MHSVKQVESIHKRYHTRKKFLSILNVARNQEQIEIFSDKSLITGSVLKVRIFVSAFFLGGSCQQVMNISLPVLFCNFKLNSSLPNFHAVIHSILPSRILFLDLNKVFYILFCFNQSIVARFDRYILISSLTGSLEKSIARCLLWLDPL